MVVLFVLEILSTENFQEIKPEYLVKWKAQPVDGVYSYYEIELSVCCFGRLRVVPLSLSPSCVTRKKTVEKMAV